MPNKTEQMKLITILSFVSTIDDSEFSVAAWESPKNICDIDDSSCLVTGLYFGTDDSREPKFCPRHYFLDIVSGDGHSNYNLVPIRSRPA